jgi:hypothetical protein
MSSACSPWFAFAGSAGGFLMDRCFEMARSRSSGILFAN